MKTSTDPSLSAGFNRIPVLVAVESTFGKSSNFSGEQLGKVTHFLYMQICQCSQLATFIK